MLLAQVLHVRVLYSVHCDRRKGRSRVRGVVVGRGRSRIGGAVVGGGAGLEGVIGGRGGAGLGVWV